MPRQTSPRKQSGGSSTLGSTTTSDFTSSRSATDSPSGMNDATTHQKPRDAGQPKSRRGKQKHALQKEDTPGNGRLDRNRLAAARLRERTKDKNFDLEQRMVHVEKAHNELWNECESLVNQIVALKQAILLHAHCNNPNIDQWIQNEASRWTHVSSML